jgi:hypothetical protein
MKNIVVSDLSEVYVCLLNVSTVTSFRDDTDSDPDPDFDETRGTMKHLKLHENQGLLLALAVPENTPTLCCD